MIKQFDRNYSIVVINHAKLKEFKYCVLTYSGDIHQLLSDELIANNKILSYLKENSSIEFDFLRENLKDKLFKLPETMAVYPGHGDRTSIGHEKRNNPYIW